VFAGIGNYEYELELLAEVINKLLFKNVLLNIYCKHVITVIFVEKSIGI